jgi:Toprim-like/DnaB-like helicase C terminal domain
MCRTRGEDTTGDNLVVYEDGKYCFACTYQESVDNSVSFQYRGSRGKDQDLSKSTYELHMKDIYTNSVSKASDLVTKSTTYQYVEHRGISKDTLKAYGVEVKVVDEDPVSIGYPYGPKACKVRMWDRKEFYCVGEFNEAPLFGQDVFSAGSCDTITITEGELDALSVFQILGHRNAAVSVRGAATAGADCRRSRDYLNSFKQIYLCFDADDPGQNAAREVARLFDPNKLRHVKLTKYKDANEYLEAGDHDEFRRVWHSAKPYLPKGIIGDFASIEEILKKEDKQATATYPFPTLDTMAYGIRQGELVLLTAQEKIGKTEVLRAIEYHLLKTTDHSLGIIHLEESEKRSVQGLVSYELGVPVHLPDSGTSTEDVYKAYTKLAGRDGRVFFYTHFGADDPGVILDAIRSLVAVCGCRYVFLDHLTMLVSGSEGDDERRTLDYLATRLAMLTRELNFTLFLVSHVNDDGKPRGSRMIAKTCDLHVYLHRDKECADATVRNTLNLMVRDNRYGAITGPAGTLTFDPKSFTLKETPRQVEVEFDPTIN